MTALAATLPLLASASPDLDRLTAGRKASPPFRGELRLDMDDPIIDVAIGRVPLRLRVALNQKRLIELNPDAVGRLTADPPMRGFRFEGGFAAQVGRETLPGRQAAAPLMLNGRNMVVTLSSHGRPCCSGVDGEIGIGLLPYATIRFVRPGSDTANDGFRRSADFLIDDHAEHGPQTEVTVGRERIFAQFSLDRPDSVATASAGVLLARSHGGRLGDGGTMVAAFGIERPVATLRLDRPAMIAGFPYRQIAVRTADFGGRLTFPVDPAEPRDIVVARKIPVQRAWPVVLIGRDRLDQCDEARFDGNAKVLTLRCSIQEVE